MSQPEGRRFAGALAAVAFVQLALLLVGARAALGRLNPDGVAYLRLARYLREGSWSLALSGYWGPLLSVLMAPFVGVGDPLLAARAAMVLSALVFLTGCAALLGVMGLRHGERVAACLVAALASVAWSTATITPDLLFAGLFAFATGQTLDDRWLTRQGALASGVLWGLAYYAKGIAVPIALVSLGLVGLLRLRRGDGRSAVLRSTLLSLLGLGAVSLPWIVALSVHYGRPTVSTSGTLTYAAVGPRHLPWVHPFDTTLNAPAAGRITSWEDPDPASYRPWSPLESREYLAFQLRLAQTNLRRIVGHLLTFAVAALAPLSLVAAAFLVVGQACRPRPAGSDEAWPWAVLPALVVCLLYIPTFARDLRYLYPAFPICLGLSLRLARRLAARRPSPALGPTLTGLVLAAYLLPVLGPLWASHEPRINPGAATARLLATRLEGLGLAGPVAGGGIAADHAGLFAAFFLEERWLGDEPPPHVADFLRMGARVLLVNPEAPTRAEFAADSRLRDVTRLVWPRGSPPPLRVYVLTAP
jgi:hypothetical protein